MTKSNIVSLVLGVILGVVLMQKFAHEQITIKTPTISADTTILAPIPIPRVEIADQPKESAQSAEITAIEYIEVPNPINSELQKKYEAALKANDSLAQLNLYKEAITERLYQEFKRDTLIDIVVESEVVGLLKKQRISYTIKPQGVTIQQPRERWKMYVGGDIWSDGNLGVGLNLTPPDGDKIFSCGVDTEKRLNIGVKFKIF